MWQSIPPFKDGVYLLVGAAGGVKRCRIL